jgi:hypothetical protein
VFPTPAARPLPPQLLPPPTNPPCPLTASPSSRCSCPGPHRAGRRETTLRRTAGRGAGRRDPQSSAAAPGMAGADARNDDWPGQITVSDAGKNTPLCSVFKCFHRQLWLVPLNATTRAGGGTKGKGWCNDRAWIRNAQFDMCDVSGCCCDEIDRMPLRRCVVAICRVTVERRGLSLFQHHDVTIPPCSRYCCTPSLSDTRRLPVRPVSRSSSPETTL